MFVSSPMSKVAVSADRSPSAEAESRARESVARFVGRSLELEASMADVASPDAPYIILAGEEHSFRVDPSTGEVMSATFPYSLDRAVAVTSATARAAARSFVQHEFLGFENLTQVNQGDLVDHEAFQTYEFQWQAILDGQIRTPTFVSVGVHAATGTIQHYTARRVRVGRVAQSCRQRTPNKSRSQHIRGGREMGLLRLSRPGFTSELISRRHWRRSSGSCRWSTIRPQPQD